MRLAVLPLVVALLVATLVAIPAIAGAEPMRAVVRHAGGGDDLVLARLDGHIVDLDVAPIEVERALERGLDRQIAAARVLAERHDAAAVVWFVADGDQLLVVVATPRDRRVFLREIDAGDPSATAEAAAQAARTALRAIALGGTIGVEVPVELVAEPPAPVEPPPRGTPLRWHGAVGWQVALDGGADVGGHAGFERLGLARGRWGGALELSLGPPLGRAGDVEVELSRSAVLAVVEHRRGDLRVALGIGAVLYQRTTLDVPAGVEATDRAISAALALAPGASWTWRPTAGRWGVELSAALDLVIGAPELAVQRGDQLETLVTLGTFQPRLGLAVVIGG